MQYFYPIIAYLVGAIPFGLLLSNTFGKANLRETGSKNIGATNVMRTQGKVLGTLTFILDFLKGFGPCYFLQADSETVNLLVIAAPVIGHVFPVWLNFKGGKGIAAYFGVLCALNPFTFLGTAAIWLAMYLITKISAIGGMVSVVTSLFIFGYVKHSLCLDFLNQLYVLIALVALIVARHHENIKRLLNDEELKV